MADNGFYIKTPPEGIPLRMNGDGALRMDNEPRRNSLTVKNVSTLVTTAAIVISAIAWFFYVKTDVEVLKERVKTQEGKLDKIETKLDRVLFNQITLAKKSGVRVDIPASSALKLNEIDLSAVEISGD